MRNRLATRASHPPTRLRGSGRPAACLVKAPDTGGESNDDTHHITKRPPAAAAFAASVPTGQKQGGEQTSVAWLRKQQYFSRGVGADSEAPERYRTGVFRWKSEDHVNNNGARKHPGSNDGVLSEGLRKAIDACRRHAELPGFEEGHESAWTKSHRKTAAIRWKCASVPPVC